MVKMMLIDCGNLSSLSYLTPHMLHERIELDEYGGEREGVLEDDNNGHRSNLLYLKTSPTMSKCGINYCFMFMLSLLE